MIHVKTATSQHLHLCMRAKKYTSSERHLPSCVAGRAHTEWGLPGMAELAVSSTAKPCFKMRSVDRTPRPHRVYSWELPSPVPDKSSMAKSRI